MKPKTQEQLLLELEDLRARLDEAEDTLRAIRSGEVDALVVSGVGGEQVYTLKGADHSYRVLIEDMNEGALMTTSDGVILYSNRCFAEMIKTPLERVVGSMISTWIVPDSQDILQVLLLQDDTETRRHGQITLLASDGALVPGHLSTNILQMEETRDLFGLVVTDLSQSQRNMALAVSEKLAQQSLAASSQSRRALLSVIEDQKRAEDELRNLAADLKRSNTELEQFAYVASHDLQEPLRMISSYTTLLEKRYKDKLDQDANDFIGIVVDGANRMQKMINALLVYSRTTRDHSPLQRVDCNAVIEDVKRNLQLSIQESGAIIQADPLPTIVGYPVLLLGLFQNVMSNSIKFQQGTKPLVAITVQKNNTHWIFSVKDNGIGIDPQYFDTIFIIFQRLHPIDEFPGTGIGLSICKNIVERHGGTIWVESEPHNGTTLYFTISSQLKEQ